MPLSSWDNAKQLFLEALAQPEPQRQEFVGKRCGANETLRQDVMSLLALHNEAARVDNLDFSLSYASAETSEIASAESHHIAKPAMPVKESEATASVERIAGLWNARYEVLER